MYPNTIRQSDPSLFGAVEISFTKRLLDFEFLDVVFWSPSLTSFDFEDCIYI